MTQARIDHPERLIHAGSLSRPAHERHHRVSPWLVFVVIVVVVLLAAHVALTIITH